MANPLIRSNLASVGQRPSLATLCVPMAQTSLWNELGGGAQAPDAVAVGPCESSLDGLCVISPLINGVTKVLPSMWTEEEMAPVVG